ncbi:hypothetical protein OZL92_16080 [Bacillus sonorensis]|uniref:Lipoprotein n=2 Tax=Bacillus sonorensis TaxID=119858 RepID=M5NXL7_9BACI|nr:MULTISPECIES: hypothetical protein [Bacillus]TWK78712.1 hypothetical protein CHCC20335_1768 [Bacillus paralicheniformis]ASB91337.1 hypothetical protein S101395_04849 [Bacillus sonorensis]EME72626.1 hypothetical protein BSONL12_20185 [Bacillus sonorensis L12]MBG9917326.1 hypothetical protein [Bacillus sonorensis]MCY8027218.1 hypothetical protein [Bacillus sonorensis]
MKQYKVLFLLFVLFLAGCSSTKENKWFDSEEKAIEYGAKSENISKNDILEKVDLDGEKVIVFRFTESAGKGICIANIIHKDNKYQWNRDFQHIILKSEKSNIGNLDVSAKFKTPQGKKYKLYIGVADKPNFTFETDEGLDTTPTIDEKTKMYYYIMAE